MVNEDAHQARQLCEVPGTFGHAGDAAAILLAQSAADGCARVAPLS